MHLGQDAEYRAKKYGVFERAPQGQPSVEKPA